MLVPMQQPTNGFEAVHADYLPMLEGAIEGLTDSTLLSTAEQFCLSEECSMTQNDQVLLADRDHLNADGGDGGSSQMKV